MRIDVDNDGDHDVLFSNNNAMAELYLTPGIPHQWLGLSLRMADRQRLRSVSIETSERNFVFHPQLTGFLSSHDPRLLWNFNPGETFKSLTLSFYHDQPDITLSNLTLNRYHTIQNIDGMGTHPSNKTYQPTPQESNAQQTIQTLPYALARWQLIAHTFDINQLTRSFIQWPLNEQLLFIQDIHFFDTHLNFPDFTRHS